jgi:uncharacterized surface protein with fasciclin (FAS1) repeats
MSYITQVIFTDKHMTTLKKGILASGLSKTLSTQGPFTFFAPSDEAFAKLEIGAVAHLLEPAQKEQLTDLLNHHLVEGKINVKDMEHGDKLKTVNGKELSVEILNGTVSLNGINLTHSDVATSNGVIHSLNSVLAN